MSIPQEPASQTYSTAQSSLHLPAIKNIHKDADELIKKTTSEFENDLRLQANILAKDDELVIGRHVREALTIIRRQKALSWFKELPILFGGTLLGTFLQGFLTELSQTSLRSGWIALYVFLGLIGLSFIFFGFLKKYGV